MSKRNPIYNDSSGITVVEIMVAFVITCLIVGVSIHYANQIIFNKKVQTSKENITKIKSNIVSVFSGDSGDYIGLTKASAKSANIFPRDMVQSDESARNVWGGDVLIYSTGKGNRSFVIGLKDVPKKVCPHLVDVQGFDLVRVNKKKIDKKVDLHNICTEKNTITYRTN